ncbi:VirB4 family type IV secretion system protein [Nocardia sp. CA-128927]|uniref:VirB4 family type IV secretion system protein n=1 Tax=Nocardia sp. CA-128927 TaxID=3239975 RepID=UPI003D97FE10
MTTPIRIPADVERADRIVGPFTARQLLVLAATTLLGYLAWILTRTVITPPVFLAVAVPVGVTVAVTVLTTRDGLAADQLLLAAIHQHLRPRTQLLAPEGIDPAPRWLTKRAADGSEGGTPQPLSPSDLHLPGAVTSAGSDQVGVVDLGRDGLAVIAAAGTVNLGLRTPDEQEGLVDGLSRYLHALSGHGVQILIRTARLDLHGRITELQAATEAMSPDLALAALDHANHLGELGRDGDLLCRQVLLVFREPLDLATIPAGTLGGPSVGAVFEWLMVGRHRARHQQLTATVRRAAESRLLRRLNEARELLAAAEITVTALDDAQAAAILTDAANPASLVPSSAETASRTTVITTGDSEFAGTELDDDAPTEADAAIGGDDVRGRWLGRWRSNRHSGVGHEFAPDSLSIGARHLDVGSDHVATLAITGYPREVHPGWLAPLLTHPGRLELALHIEPVDPVTAASRLRRQLGRLEAARMHNADHGRMADPQIEVAVEDAHDLSSRVARGEGRLFRVGVYLTVHASTAAELTEEVAAVRALAASLLIDTCHVSYRSVQGWVSTLPLGLDLVKLRRTFDTAALAAAFPFSSPQLPAEDPVTVTNPTGVLYGHDAGSGLLFWDRFASTVDNHNAVVLGRSGSGKSYFLKAEMLRSLYRGIEVICIDPEDEYRRLAEAVGGTYIHLGAAGVRLNPFDLEVHTRPDGRRAAPADALNRRKLFLHTVLRVLFGEPTPAQRAVLDAAITASYASVGITEDPTTWTTPAPTMRVLREQLLECGAGVGVDLAAALQPYVGDGAFAGLLDGPTTTVPDGAMIVFSLRELPDELKTIGTLLALDATWRRVSNPGTRRPRLVNVDEAWILMRQPAGAEFLLRAAKAFRKLWAGLTVATQDCADVLGSDLGKAIVANSATQILLRQAPQAINEVTAAFSVSDGERRFLLAAARGHGLLSTGAHRAVFAAVASAAEHDLITSNPGELTQTTSDTNVYIGTADTDTDEGLDAIATDSDLDDGDGDSYIDLQDAA